MWFIKRTLFVALLLVILILTGVSATWFAFGFISVANGEIDSKTVTATVTGLLLTAAGIAAICSIIAKKL